MVHLQQALAVAIAWEKYWRLGESEEQIELEATEPVVGWISSYPSNARMSVYLYTPKWRVDLATDSAGNWSAYFVDKICGSPRPECDVLTKIEVKMAADTIRRVCHPAGDMSKVRETIRSVVRKSDVESFLYKHRETEFQRSKLWIGEIVECYPYVYYYLDGVPYLGEVELDCKTGSVVHDELLYIRETPRESDFRHIIARLREKGKAEEWAFKLESLETKGTEANTSRSEGTK